MTYDHECYQLAAYFLEDEPCRSDPKIFEQYCDSLAQHIQKSIEDWFVMPDVDGTFVDVSGSREGGNG